MGIRNELESFFANAGTWRQMSPRDQKDTEMAVLDLCTTVERILAERESLLREIADLKKTNQRLLSIIEKQVDR